MFSLHLFIWQKKLISMEMLQKTTLSTQMLYFHISDAILLATISLDLYELTSVGQIPDYKVSIQKVTIAFDDDFGGSKKKL